MNQSCLVGKWHTKKGRFSHRASGVVDLDGHGAGLDGTRNVLAKGSQPKD